MEFLKKEAHQIIKRKITVLTSRYRLLSNKRKNNNNLEKDAFIKSNLLKMKQKINKLKKLKSTPEKLIRTGLMGERYVYNDLDELFYTNIMFRINDKLFGFIYDDSNLTIEYKDIDSLKNYNFQIKDNTF